MSDVSQLTELREQLTQRMAEVRGQFTNVEARNV